MASYSVGIWSTGSGHSSGSTRSRGSVVVIGLNNSGKTSATYQLALGKKVDTLPTLGSECSDVTVGGHIWTVVDVGGSSHVRSSWGEFVGHADGVVFVVDSTDEKRLPEACEALHALYGSRGDDVKSRRSLSKAAPLMVLINKQDSKKAMKPKAVLEALRFEELDVPVKFSVNCSSTKGDGIVLGFTNLFQSIFKERTRARKGYSMSAQPDGISSL